MRGTSEYRTQTHTPSHPNAPGLTVPLQPALQPATNQHITTTYTQPPSNSQIGDNKLRERRRQIPWFSMTDYRNSRPKAIGGRRGGLLPPQNPPHSTHPKELPLGGHRAPMLSQMYTDHRSPRRTAPRQQEDRSTTAQHESRHYTLETPLNTLTSKRLAPQKSHSRKNRWPSPTAARSGC